MDHPKKRRRRRIPERIPLCATLILDADLKGEEGILTPGFHQQVFPTSISQERQLSGPKPQYIAVSTSVSQTPTHYQDLDWTILPVKAQQSDEEFDKTDNTAPTITLGYPASSVAVQSIFGATSPPISAKSPATGTHGIPVLVLDVEPVWLTSVYVSVDGDALERHEQIQREYGGGFGTFRQNSQGDKGKGKAKVTDQHGLNGLPAVDTKQQQEKDLTAAVRNALASLSVVHQGDSLPLPLPAHPITHVPLPPAKVVLCEPVDQGLLSPDTRITVNRYHGFAQTMPGTSKHPLRSHRPQRDVQNGEASSTEQFFSATENISNGHTPEDLSIEETSESSSSEEGTSSESEESADDFISLSTPNLSSPPKGILSSVTTTPKLRSVRNGTSTPGSVYSSYTATTARQLSGIGKSFQACSLLAQIPTDLLHPKPSPDEDHESRVYVDVKDLVKLRCFSGDWVKLRVALRCSKQAERWDLNAFDDANGDEDYRVGKVYGLPDVSPRPAIHSLGKETSLSHRKSSVATCTKSKSLAPQAWLSPILLANLGFPSEICMAPLIVNDAAKRPFSPKSHPAKARRPGYPPVAEEVSLAKVATPISQEAAMQEQLFLRLKQYFESKRRVVKSGDLIAVTVDTRIGRIFGPSSASDEHGQGMEDLLSLIGKSTRSDAASVDVIWFKVGHIGRIAADKPGEDQQEEIWGGAACIDPATTRMTMGTSEQSTLPSVSQSTWRPYLGLVPRPPTEKFATPLSVSMSASPRPYVSPLQRRLRELMAAASSPRATHFGIEPTLILLHSSQRNIGKYNSVTRAASDLGLHTFLIDAYDIISEGNAGDVQESSINTRIARGLSCGAQFTTLVIRHLEALTSNRMIAALRKAAKSVRILIATTTQLDQIPDNLRSLFTHEIEMSAPDEGERNGILRTIVEELGIRTAHDVDLGAIAVKTAALVAGNLVDIVERAVIARQTRMKHLVGDAAARDNHSQITIRDLVVSGGEWARCVTKTDFDVAVDAARKNFADAIGAPKIPNVSWSDVGGLENVKDAVMETIQLPLERPELFAKGMKKRSGILFYGPPGTGKTLLAKAIATEFSLNFFSVKGPELLNMYIGESEANVRRVFQRARDARPCVVFFDELDSVAPKRGNQGDSGGVMDRIVSQLLAELDGMSDGDDGGGGVFVIGATNRPDLLDQALLRPGRFDKMLYLGISDTHQKQLTILEALTRKFSLDPHLSLARVAASLPFTYTGADLYALCSDAMLKAITRQASAVDAKIKALPNGPMTTAYFFDHLATKEDIAVNVTEEDFEAAKRELVGSVR
ncbi:MAG: hypothetical protein Q9182_005529 [Xanthomendoza sp. 2 TL-2023]